MLDYDSLTLSMRDASWSLPQKEFLLLYKLASYPGKIFTRQQLIDEIWGLDSESDIRTVDVHVNRLRERPTSTTIFTSSPCEDLGIRL